MTSETVDEAEELRLRFTADGRETNLRVRRSLDSWALLEDTLQVSLHESHQPVGGSLVLRGVDVRTGSYARKGAFIGGAGGFILGAVGFGFGVTQEDPGPYDFDYILLRASIGAALGTGLGLLIGSLSPCWNQVYPAISSGSRPGN